VPWEDRLSDPDSSLVETVGSPLTEDDGIEPIDHPQCRATIERCVDESNEGDLMFAGTKFAPILAQAFKQDQVCVYCFLETIR